MKLSMKFWNFFMDLDASDEQLDCPFVYASAKAGYAVLDLADDTGKDMSSAV